MLTKFAIARGRHATFLTWVFVALPLLGAWAEMAHTALGPSHACPEHVLAADRAAAPGASFADARETPAEGAHEGCCCLTGRTHARSLLSPAKARLHGYGRAALPARATASSSRDTGAVYRYAPKTSPPFPLA